MYKKKINSAEFSFVLTLKTVITLKTEAEFIALCFFLFDTVTVKCSSQWQPGEETVYVSCRFDDSALYCLPEGRSLNSWCPGMLRRSWPWTVPVVVQYRSQVGSNYFSCWLDGLLQSVPVLFRLHVRIRQWWRCREHTVSSQSTAGSGAPEGRLTSWAIMGSTTSAGPFSSQCLWKLKFRSCKIMSTVDTLMMTVVSSQ